MPGTTSRATRTEPYERMQVWHADVPPHGGDALVFDAAEMGERDLGVIAENNVLQAALAGAARRAGIVLVEGEVDALEQERDAAVTARGTSDRSARAAGRRRRWRASRVRELAGLAATRADYGQTAHRRHGEHGAAASAHRVATVPRRRHARVPAA